jgi:phosphatidylinositol 3-kinase
MFCINGDILISFIPQLVKKYERGDLPKSDWLDTMAFRKMEEIHAVSSLSQPTRKDTSIEPIWLIQAETEKSENLFLYIDLPRFDFPVIFSEPVSLSLSFVSG